MDERTNPFLGKRVAFAGKLGGVNTREASTLVRRLGGTPVPRDDERIDLLVLGADEVGQGEVGQASPPAASVTSDETSGRRGRLPHEVTTLSETELWRQLGLLDDDGSARRLYTPAMLAEMLDVPIASIRRWHRSGLIQAQQTIHRLPYFAFEEIVVARRLVELVENGASPAVIEARLRELVQKWPGVNRPLAQLSLLVEGRRLLVKHGDAILEPGGQQRFDFTSLSEENDDDAPHTIPLRPQFAGLSSPTREQLAAYAEELEEAGDLAAAADAYRAALAAGPPCPALCFTLAECLYRRGDLSAARERYAMAIELDETFIEARANLGCVLEELGHADLAIAALQGAISLHADYADAHYHLARLLAASGNSQQAAEHRRRFADLAPSSPWGGIPMTNDQ